MPFKKISFSLIFLMWLVPFFSLSGADKNTVKFDIARGTAPATQDAIGNAGQDAIGGAQGALPNGEKPSMDDLSRDMEKAADAAYDYVVKGIKKVFSKLSEYVSSTNKTLPSVPKITTPPAPVEIPTLPSPAPMKGLSVNANALTFFQGGSHQPIRPPVLSPILNGGKEAKEAIMQFLAQKGTSATQFLIKNSQKGFGVVPTTENPAVKAINDQTRKLIEAAGRGAFKSLTHPSLPPETITFDKLTTVFTAPFKEVPQQLGEYASAGLHHLREIGSTLATAYDNGHLGATISEWFSTPSDTMSPLQKKLLVGAVAGYVLMSFMKNSSDAVPASTSLTDIQSQDQDKEIGRYELLIDTIKTTGTTAVVAQGSTILALKNDFIEKMGGLVVPGERELVLSIAVKITYKNAHFFQGPTNLPAQKNVCPLETQPLPVHNMPITAGHVTTPGHITSPAVLISVSLGNFFDAKILPRITSHYERFPTTVVDDQKTTYEVVMIWDRSDSYRIVKFLKNSITFGKFGDFTASSLAELKQKMLVELADNYLTYREGNLLVKISARSPHVYPGTFALSTIKVTMPPMTIPGPPAAGGAPTPQARISDAESGLVRRWTTDMLTKGIADWHITYRNERERLAQEIWDKDFAPHLPTIVIPEPSWFLSTASKAAALAGIGYWSLQKIQEGHYKEATASLPLLGVVGLGLWQQLTK